MNADTVAALIRRLWRVALVVVPLGTYAYWWTRWPIDMLRAHGVGAVFLGIPGLLVWAFDRRP